MKILTKNLKKGFIKILVDRLDDLWYLSHIVEKGDLVSGKTVRKIKAAGPEERSSRVRTERIYLEIEAEKVDLDLENSRLRVSGRIVDGPEDVPKGSYHSFCIEEGTSFQIIKERWASYQIKKLEDAVSSRRSNVLIVAFDRESAAFALLQDRGVRMLSELKGSVAKKDRPESVKSDFYQEIALQISSYDEKYEISKIVLASPAFWKEYLLRAIGDEGIRKKIITAGCNAAGPEGIDEVLKRPEVRTALSEGLVVEEIKLVEELLLQIRKDGTAAYGLDEVERAADSGAVKALLVSDLFLHSSKESGLYPRLDRLMEASEEMRSEVHIIQSGHEGGKKLDGLGGVAALLRYRIA